MDITLYLTRRDPGLLQRDFRRRQKATVPVNAPDATPRPASLKAPAGFTWLQASFDEQGGKQVSDVLYTAISGWEYEVRATYRPEECSRGDGGHRRSAPDTVGRTAGTHLAACAAAPARNGQRNTNLDALRARWRRCCRHRQAGRDRAACRSGTWCVSATPAFGIGNAVYIAWHNAAPAPDGPIDRITNLAGGYSVITVRDPADLLPGLAGEVR